MSRTAFAVLAVVGLVIFGDDSGALRAADAVTGQPLWSFPVKVTNLES